MPDSGNTELNDMSNFERPRPRRKNKVNESLERLRQSMWEALNTSTDVGREAAAPQEAGWNPSLSVNISLESAARESGKPAGSGLLRETYSAFDADFLHSAGIAFGPDPEKGRVSDGRGDVTL
jgi:hypothetical protein